MKFCQFPSSKNDELSKFLQNPDCQRVLEMFRKLSPENQEIALKQIEDLAKTPTPRFNKKNLIISMAVVGLLLCCAIPFDTASQPVTTTAPRSGSATICISYDTKLISNDHVGDDWGIYCDVNGFKLESGAYFKTDINSPLHFTTSFIENDSNPDIGTSEYTLFLSEYDLSEPIKFSQCVEVVETDGRYSGNKAFLQTDYTIVIML